MLPSDFSNKQLLRVIHYLTILVMILLLVIVFIPVLIWKGDALVAFFTPKPVTEKVTESFVDNVDTFWHARDITAVDDTTQRALLAYGKDLVAHTAKYLGPKGSVMTISNGMNCQNCHLDAGTRVYGNNYGAVASLYPKFRTRSGTEETVFKRINDCVERSLNGRSLDSNGRELQAMKAYITFIGSNVKKGKKGAGSGLKDLAYLDRAADPIAGQAVFLTKCASCHGNDGQGQFTPDGNEYSYPPLWGPHSYNDAAGLYRLSNFARYVKWNMPLGATHMNAQLGDAEAWDVAAYVNTQARPHKSVPNDWPDISKKPIDHPYGPYADSFSEKQHKLGPFKPIQAFYQKNQPTKKIVAKN